MTGWSKKVAGSRVGSFNTQKVQKTEPGLKNLANIEENGEKNADKKFKCIFNDLLEGFLKEVSGGSTVRPLSRLIFDGQEVDLLKLFFVVRQRGGYESVSTNGSWGLAAKECGFKSRIGVALKLVYNRYLYKLDQWLRENVLVKQEVKMGVKERDLSLCGLSMDLKSDLKVFLLGIIDKKKEDGEFMNAAEIKTDSFGSEKEFKDRVFVESNGSVKKREELVNEKVDEKRILNNGVKGGIENFYFDENKSGIDGRKRKRECDSSRMLNWIGKVAEDPCNPEIGSLPERHKWKYYDGEQLWKQILLVREVMLLKRNIGPSSQQSIWQKKQKMHPSLYGDQNGSRCSQRFISMDSSSKSWDCISSDSSSSGFQSDDHADKQSLSTSTADSICSLGNYLRRKRIPIGPLFQAGLPEFSGEAYNIDSKWVGTKIWPLEKGEVKKTLIERDRIGKGRQESCGCEFPGSAQCVRFHVGEKRMRVKLEAGSAFYGWKFDGMGEEVALSWTKEEENKFNNILKSKISSSEKYFWDELFQTFPHKGRESLVSYYYNVFLLRRRGYQNRTSTSNIDSDDDESGPLRNRFGQMSVNSPASIFCSPKKPAAKKGS